ncbi:MAG: hypothetical protein HOH04_17190 [Rhodospirillaceae bacterium]|nr:hypothetical protein [Rhodospirillaceae bacterium]
MDAPISPPPRRRPWLWLAAAPLLFGVAVLAGWLWRIDIASWALQRELTGRGFDEATVTITRLDLSQIELAPARLGPDLAAAKITTDYDIGYLLAGRLDTVDIRVLGLEIDISSPQKGALGRIQAIAAEDPQTERSVTLPPLPTVTMTDARIYSNIEPARLDFRFQASTRVVDGAQHFTLSKGHLADRRDKPLFHPLGIGAEGNIKGSKATLRANLSAADEAVRLVISAGHDLQTTHGTLDWKLSPLVLGGSGISPSTVTPLAAMAENWTAGLVAQGNASWSPGTQTGTVKANLAGVAGAVKGLSVKDFGADLSANFSVADKTVHWKARNVHAELHAQQHGLGLRGARLSGQLNGWGADASVMLEHAVLASADFATLNLSGHALATDFTALWGNLVTTALDGRVQATTTFHHDLSAQSGQAQFQLDPLGFHRTHLQPNHLSRRVDIGGILDGSVAATAEAVWKGGNLSGKTEMVFSKLGFSKPGLALRRWDGAMTATQSGSNAPIAFVFNGKNGEISAQGREFAFGPIDLAGQWIDGKFDTEGSLKMLRHIALQPLFAPLGLRFSATGDTAAVDFTADIEQDRSTRLTTKGRFDIAKSDVRARLTVPPMRFTDSSLTPAKISPLLALADSVAGALEGGADIHVTAGELSGTAHASLDNVTIRKDETRIEGVSGRIDLARLMPPLTRGTQTLSARRIIAGTELLAPTLTYRIEASPDGPLPRLAIEAARVGIAGGSVSLLPTHIDANRDDHDIDLDLDGVDLKTLMDLIAVEGVSAEGQLSGRLPIHISRDKVFVRNGELKAAGPGVLRLRSQAARQALSGGGAQVDLVLDVLRDFRYQKLTLTINRLNDGSDIVRLSTEGRNPAVKKGREIHLNVNLETNLDKLLAIALDGYRLSQDALRATLGGVTRK